MSILVPTCPVSAAGSNGRCNTLHCIDSTMLSSANYLFGRVQTKPSQVSVPVDPTTPRVFSFCFQCRIGLYLVLHRPIETTRVTGKVEASTDFGEKRVQEFVLAMMPSNLCSSFSRVSSGGCRITLEDEGGRTPYYQRPMVRCGQIRFKGELLGMMTQSDRLGHW
jgi:hypothetical protein